VDVDIEVSQIVLVRYGADTRNAIASLVSFRDNPSRQRLLLAGLTALPSTFLSP
jgi:hypothetical protein